MNKYNKENRISPQRDTLGRISLLISIFIVVLMYWRWFLPGAITLGDWGYYTKSALSDMTGGLWSDRYRIIGGSIHPLLSLTGFLSRSLPWDYAIIERITCFFPLLLFSIFSPWYLAHTLGLRRMGAAAAIIVFNLNTYTFTIVAVTTLALSIAIGPFVLAAFIKLVHKPSFRTSLFFALVLAIQIVYEIRMAYIFLLFCSIYFVYFILTSPDECHRNLLKLVKMFLLAILVTSLLHSFWLIPLLLVKDSGATLGQFYSGYNASSWVRTLSYWNLLHVLGLQSPWWGKPGIVNPPNPQFLLLPILAFSVFLFSRKSKQTILFFGLSAIVFSFLAKGSKPPLGEVYIWLFEHFPGFFMFREPGKWWAPVALSYAVLIGSLADECISAENIKQLLLWLKSKFNFSMLVSKAGLVLIAIAAFFIIFPVQPISTFKNLAIFIHHPIPKESGYLESFLRSQEDFFRVLWLPTAYRFGYDSSQRPGFTAIDLGQGMLASLRSSNLSDSTEVFSYLSDPFTLPILRLLCIKYLIVPSVPEDSSNEFYYWYGLPFEYYSKLAGNAPGVYSTDFKGKSRVYELKGYLPHLYISNLAHIVLSGSDSPPAVLAGMDCLKSKNPVLIFPEQSLEAKASLLAFNNFILQNMTFADFVDEVSFVCKVPFLVHKKAEKLRSKFKMQKAGVYEFWIDSASKSNIEKFRIKIDSQVIFDRGMPYWLKGVNQEQEYIKYFKIGELDLMAGVHNLEVDFKDSNFEQPFGVMLSVTDRAERLSNQDFISVDLKQPRKNVSYIFTGDGYFYVE